MMETVNEIFGFKNLQNTTNGFNFKQPSPDAKCIIITMLYTYIDMTQHKKMEMEI